MAEIFSDDLLGPGVVDVADKEPPELDVLQVHLDRLFPLEVVGAAPHVSTSTGSLLMDKIIIYYIHQGGNLF